MTVSSENGKHRRRPATRTWSLLGDVKRKPNPYEVVTSKFHYHFRRDPAPFEMDPNTPLNKWYLQYREGSPLQVEDWEQFRDPHRLTYKDYVAVQRDRETYVDALIDQAESSGSAGKLSAGWVSTLRELFVPLRFPLHVLQMTGLYVGQMAPSSFITNCANFQAADELRRIQRIAYWTKVLSLSQGADLAESATARRPWETDPRWQPLRKLLEEMLIAYDWGEAFTALNLAAKPMLDALVNEQLSALAEANGDAFLANLLAEFDRDSKRSQDWTQALVAYTLDRDPALRDVVEGWLARWQPQAKDAIDALSGSFGTAPVPMAPEAVSGNVARRYANILEECGLSVPTPMPV
ncbi:aromatic/alkene monooxygenase hydroxylase subunit beta [Mycobacterium sp. TY815]|uniref:aromatic/alkene monooxygenase hydroxylase subunit beta n=1 Tax=Mycobacterium sp. TY815 TaxID=3050581 RepID=UPI002740CE45|nr:aromatic/alkene monooxygenase hydroxylase subunit beta [Mycobacterium sp. TY815]MDP7704823.1 aromatic/alkene monooxygenase hydroxylase subunit beta [Mycobacterium sp. TY815]